MDQTGNYHFGRLIFDPVHCTISLGRSQIRVTSQQTALLVHLAEASTAVTAGELIAAGLFPPDAARSTVHSTLLMLRRKVDGLEPGLGVKLLSSTPRGYSIGPVV